MANDAGMASTVVEQRSEESQGGFFANILTPGSSLNPTFLLILDGAFGTLLLVLFSLFVITHWNLHLLFLMIIEGCLWASVKWFVHELQQVRSQEQSAGSVASTQSQNAHTKPKAE
ncbi:hypothetical protein C8Q77DRAFT_385858 [Trametes polyzona]|nr:hypothetical protein C8Q77DRAFT_385858 [Trametes polyzona]